ncbi:MAG: alpha/beta hydrolase [Planctomycetaceae bacterium]|nr:alpha/beta hydrolase [Planctomycetaceae bacterium]
MLNEQLFHHSDLSLNFANGPRNGPALVFFHGVTRRWQSFVPLIPTLSSRWHIHALDHRGHGGSSRPKFGYLVRDYVRDAVAFVQEQVQGPAVLYGHSLGAMVAAGVAAELPKQVHGVVLEDPPFDTMGPRISQSALLSYFTGVQPFAESTLPVGALARQLAEIPLTTPGKAGSIRLGDTRDMASLRFTARCLKPLDRDVLSPIIAGRWLEGFDWAAALEKITCPALLLQADLSVGGMLTDDDAAEAERLMPDCSRIRLPKVGHLIHWLQTETCLRLVNSFLESLEGLPAR